MFWDGVFDLLIAVVLAVAAWAAFAAAINQVEGYVVDPAVTLSVLLVFAAVAGVIIGDLGDAAVLLTVAAAAATATWKSYGEIVDGDAENSVVSVSGRVVPSLPVVLYGIVGITLGVMVLDWGVTRGWELVSRWLLIGETSSVLWEDLGAASVSVVAGVAAVLGAVVTLTRRRVGVVVATGAAVLALGAAAWILMLYQSWHPTAQTYRAVVAVSVLALFLTVPAYRQLHN
ncbi:hypothetical protein HTZ84_20975 [Haloterrigena sp. SYSU A558-1]|uniref:Uncharacterized protein n=1 Tax=Haloterrigena gelatinilytica TaxID=2741724 RepID=A0ABX2LIN4_9EURY|nr:hypothetical protein [Haloterrigena gelatinilytica]NUC74738.1 hypothetical protein [Haloterrigena gelatinilytica]